MRPPGGAECTAGEIAWRAGALRNVSNCRLQVLWWGGSGPDSTWCQISSFDDTIGATGSGRTGRVGFKHWSPLSSGLRCWEPRSDLSTACLGGVGKRAKAQPPELGIPL